MGSKPTKQWAPKNSRWTEFENVLLVKMRTLIVSENMMSGGVVKNASVWDQIATRSVSCAMPSADCIRVSM